MWILASVHGWKLNRFCWNCLANRMASFILKNKTSFVLNAMEESLSKFQKWPSTHVPLHSYDGAVLCKTGRMRRLKVIETREHETVHLLSGKCDYLNDAHLIMKLFNFILHSTFKSFTRPLLPNDDAFDAKTLTNKLIETSFPDAAHRLLMANTEFSWKGTTHPAENIDENGWNVIFNIVRCTHLPNFPKKKIKSLC